MKVMIKTLRKRNPKRALRTRRKMHIRKLITGTTERPRLSVFRSAKHIYVQAIDDQTQATLASASTMEKELRPQVASLKKIQVAAMVGSLLAKRLQGKGIKEAVFDRNGFRYTGRVAAIAEAAREEGLLF